MRKIFVVGLTGQTGAGKSLVSKIVRSQGVEVIDCDLVSRDVVAGEKQCLADLALEFSITILNVDGTLNRKRLAGMVFGDPERLARLNELIFPYILAEVDRRVRSLEKQGVELVLLDAPTLFESGADSTCDMVVSVIAPEALRLNRIVVRDHLSDDEARRRIASQFGDQFYASRSQVVITNDGAPEDLHVRTLEMLESVRRKMLAGLLR